MVLTFLWSALAPFNFAGLPDDDAKIRNFFSQNPKQFSIMIDDFLRERSIFFGTPGQKVHIDENAIAAKDLALWRILAAFMGQDQVPFDRQIVFGLETALQTYETGAVLIRANELPVVDIWRRLSGQTVTSACFYISVRNHSCNWDRELPTLIFWKNGSRYQAAFINPCYRELLYPLKSQSVGFYSLGYELGGKHHCPGAAIEGPDGISDQPLSPLMTAN